MQKVEKLIYKYNYIIYYYNLEITVEKVAKLKRNEYRNENTTFFIDQD